MVLAIAALALGLVLGWFFGSRPIAEWRTRHGERETECKSLTERLSAMVPELATMSERAARANGLAEQLDAAREEREKLRAELATLMEKTANFEEQKRLLVEARQELLKEFQNTGHAVLSKAQEALLERAAERLGHSEKASEEKLKALLQPVGDRLAKYEQQVEALEAKRVDAFGQLTGRKFGARRSGSAIRSPTRPRRAGAGASGRCRMCSNSAAWRSIPTSTSSIRWIRKRGGCGPTPSSGCRGRNGW